MVHRGDQIADALLAGKSTDEEHVGLSDHELRETFLPVSWVVLLRIHAVVDHGHLGGGNGIGLLDVRLHVPRDGDDRVTREEAFPFHPQAHLVPGAKLFPFPRPQGFERMDRGHELGSVDPFRHRSREIRVPCVGVHDRGIDRIRDHVHVEGEDLERLQDPRIARRESAEGRLVSQHVHPLDLRRGADFQGPDLDLDSFRERHRDVLRVDARTSIDRRRIFPREDGRLHVRSEVRNGDDEGSGAGSAGPMLAPVGILPLAVRLAHDVSRIRDGLLDQEYRVSTGPVSFWRQCEHRRAFHHIGRGTLRHLGLEGGVPGEFGRFPGGSGLERGELSALIPFRELEERRLDEASQRRRTIEILCPNARLREVLEGLHQKHHILKGDPRFWDNPDTRVAFQNVVLLVQALKDLAEASVRTKDLDRAAALGRLVQATFLEFSEWHERGEFAALQTAPAWESTELAWYSSLESEVPQRSPTDVMKRAAMFALAPEGDWPGGDPVLLVEEAVADTGHIVGEAHGEWKNPDWCEHRSG